MKKIVLIATLAAAPFIVQTSSADILARWTFESSVPVGAPGAGNFLPGIVPEIGAGTATGFHLGASIYSNPTGNGSVESLSSTNWVAGDFYQFSVSTIGFSALTVSYDQVSSSTGPGQFTFNYSTDGINFTQLGGTLTVLVNTALNTWGSVTPIATTSYTNDLSAITALNESSLVYFRVTDASAVSAGGGTVAVAGTSRIDNFMVQATPVPEPQGLAVVGGLSLLATVRKRRRA
jgi:hypothetical protein